MVRNIIFLIVGVLLGWMVTYILRPEIKPVERIVVRTDTIVDKVVVKVPVPTVVVKKLTDTLVQKITNERLVEIYKVEDDYVMINRYADSTQNADYKFRYEIETIGELLSFKPEITTYRKTETETIIKQVSTKWIVSSALSNRGHFKVGLGYKGWFVDTELSHKFEQVYVGYQYHF
jgi:hypothetical protein